MKDSIFETAESGQTSELPKEAEVNASVVSNPFVIDTVKIAMKNTMAEVKAIKKEQDKVIGTS